MKMSHVKIWYSNALILSIIVSGCANPNLEDLQRFVAEKKAESPGRIEPIPEIKQIETFLYEEQGRRDPFMPMEQQVAQELNRAENGITPDFKRRKQELETYALDTLRMVGILEKSGVTYGLIKTKEGTVHKVESGNYLGQNHGKIMSISEDKIELNEIVQDGSGGYSERHASLLLTE